MNETVGDMLLPDFFLAGGMLGLSVGDAGATRVLLDTFGLSSLDSSLVVNDLR